MQRGFIVDRGKLTERMFSYLASLVDLDVFTARGRWCRGLAGGIFASSLATTGKEFGLASSARVSRCVPGSCVPF